MNIIRRKILSEISENSPTVRFRTIRSSLESHQTVDLRQFGDLRLINLDSLLLNYRAGNSRVYLVRSVFPR